LKKEARRVIMELEKQGLLMPLGDSIVVMVKFIKWRGKVRTPHCLQG